MDFYKNYKKHFDIFDARILEKPSSNLGIVVVIPSYNEKDTGGAVNALLENCNTYCDVEIIVVVNSKQDSQQSVINQNIETIKQINAISSVNKNKKVKIHCIYEPSMPPKHAGAGLARKIGMDEAVARFNAAENPDGIIVSFDADCRCSDDYLGKIECFFKNNPKTNSVSISFEHPLSTPNIDYATYIAIAQYELYLRYYIAAQKYCGFPFAYQTIGSAFAVRAKTYCAEGGMNKRQAGEDFYFLQKLITKGNHTNLTTAKVFPSPRVSDRVPFGTGAAIKKIYGTESLEVYNPTSFEIVKQLFDNRHELMQKHYPNNISPLLTCFLNQNNFETALQNIIENTTNTKTFDKRFFTWFDAFRLLKFLNFAHTQSIKKIPVEKAAAYIAEKICKTIIPQNTIDLLLFYRKYIQN